MTELEIATGANKSESACGADAACLYVDEECASLKLETLSLLEGVVAVKPFLVFFANRTCPTWTARRWASTCRWTWPGTRRAPSKTLDVRLCARYALSNLFETTVSAL